MSIDLALVLMLVLAQVDDGRFDVESFVSRHPLVDGNVNVHSPHSDVGQPDFTRDEKGKSVHARTGIRVGSMTCGKFGSLKQQAKLATTTWKGIQLIRTEADLDRCLENKLYGLLLYCQTHYGLRGGIRPLKQWHREGLRILNLQYGSGDATQSKDDRLGGGADQKGGLTPLGRKVVVEMMRIGIMVDLSHCNEQTVLETAVIAEEKKFPLLANHTCAREVKDAAGKRFANYERNMTDRAMRAIARTDGVIGIMAYRPFLRRRAHATVDDYLLHIEHAIKVAGIDHVGFSTDGYLDGSMVRDQKADGVLDAPDRWKQILVRLAKRGHTQEALRKLAGANYLRVYRKVLR